MLEVVKKQAPARKSGVSALLYYVMRGTSSGVHSSAERVLKLLISQSVFSIGDKFNQGKLFSSDNILYEQINVCLQCISLLIIT